MDTPFGREGSKGSEGSACPWQAGSKGGGIACGDEYMCRLSAAHTVITVTAIISISAAAQHP